MVVIGKGFLLVGNKWCYREFWCGFEWTTLQTGIG